MLASHPRPTVRRRRVGGELKRLREAAGITMDQAAECIGGDKSKVSRQENGRQNISKLEIEALLLLYGSDDPKMRTALITLAREGRRKGWWNQYSSLLTPSFQERLAVESDAAHIGVFQPMLVPGLLQTFEYAEVVIRAAEKDSTDEQIQSFLALRMDRQKLFERDDPPQYVCILDEATLRREIGGPEVMANQLLKLVEVNNPPKLTIQVVPFGQGWNAGLHGPFTVVTYPDPMDLDVASLDYLDGVLYLEEDDAVRRYRLAFDELRSSALPTRQSMRLISETARDFAART
jgi:transcriptional regulator with XRE-family HTH domain